MRYVSDTSSIFTRYDLALEGALRRARAVSHDPLLQRVADCLVNGNDEEIEDTVREALKSREPMDVINAGLIAGMKEVGRLWDSGAYFLPQVILSSDAMLAGIAICEEKMGRAMNRKARVVTHTAEGDIHDLGQSIVNALLSAAGFEVINLGADVPVDQVIAACERFRPIMLSGTALMTTTMSAFPRIAAGLKQRGLAIPFVCGGGAVSERFVTSFELGIWGKDAGQAPGMAEDALKGLGWAEIRARWNG